MSNIFINYIKSLIPSIRRNTILEDLRISSDEVDKNVIPAIAKSALVFSKSGFESKEANRINDIFKREMKDMPYSGSTFLSASLPCLNNLSDNIKTLEKYVEKNINNLLVTGASSTAKISIIRACESASYISRKLLDLSTYALAYESEHIKKDKSAKELYSKAELMEIDAMAPRVARLLSAYGVEPRKFAKRIASMNDLVVDDQNLETINTLSDSDLDTLSSPITTAGFTGNPIYHIRMAVAEWQVKRYESTKEKKKQLELRVIYLQSLKDGFDSPKIEKEIIYNQNRISKMEKYLKEVEDDLDV